MIPAPPLYYCNETNTLTTNLNYRKKFRHQITNGIVIAHQVGKRGDAVGCSFHLGHGQLGSKYRFFELLQVAAVVLLNFEQEGLEGQRDIQGEAVNVIRAELVDHRVDLRNSQQSVEGAVDVVRSILAAKDPHARGRKGEIGLGIENIGLVARLDRDFESDGVVGQKTVFGILQFPDGNEIFDPNKVPARVLQSFFFCFFFFFFFFWDIIDYRGGHKILDWREKEGS